MNNKTILSPLREESIRKHLRSHRVDDINPIRVFSNISSTNDYLLVNESANKKIAVCVAEQQTQGRGRHGHQWVSPSSVNLYLSMLWPLQIWKEEYEPLSLWLLIAVAELLENYGCSDIQLKWPNDICVDNKKLAGILIERKVGQTSNSLIIGIGINVAMSLSGDVNIQAPWTDLVSIKPDFQLSRNELAANVISVFYATLLKLEGGQLIDLNSMWARYDMLLNKKIEFLNQGEIQTGYVKGIDGHGQIILDLDGVTVKLHNAHISEIKLIGIS